MAAVEFEVNGHIALVTLNRPEARNSFNPEALVRLYDAFHEVETNDNIRVAVITGSGDKAFCAGADLGQLITLMNGARKPENEWDTRYVDDVSKKGSYLMNKDPVKPVVAAINGHAIAGGMELVQGTDIRVAVPEAKFGLQEVKWAIFPAGGSTVRMPRQMPYAKAMELMLTGDLISAEEALELGFLNYVVEASELMDKAMEIASKSPLAISGIKEIINYSRDHSIDESLNYVALWNASMKYEDDLKETFLAKMEKRDELFQGLKKKGKYFEK